jgi:phage shock protein A
MFKAIGRYFRALGYLATGRIDAARQALSTNPYVVQATFDRIVDEKKNRIQQYKDAVARMIAQQEQKIVRVKQLSDEVNRLEQLKEGAAAKARTLVGAMRGRGMTMEQIKQDAEYLKCMTAFNDFSSTAQEKSDHIAELEDDVKQLGESIDGHKVQLQQLLREVEKLKEEATQSVADVITAKEEREIADMISGIAADRSSKELQDMRDLRNRMKANARISRELAGTDTRRQEAEFLEYARTNVATSEFDQLIGLAEETDAAEKSTDSPQRTGEARLPEA